MEKRVGRFIIVIGVIGVLGLWILLLQNIDSASAQDPNYPTKPINFLISFGAGGMTDITSRAFLEGASKHTREPFVPINKPGGGGIVAAVAVMNSKPDGYTLGTITTSNGIAAPCSGQAPYKDLSGFSLIMNYANFIYTLMVRGDAPWKTWEEFIEWARKNPRAAKIAISGAKAVTNNGFVLSQIERKEQVEFTCVVFKSSSEQITSVLGGHVTMYMGGLDVTSVPYVQEGKLRILAYWGTGKAQGFENIPSTQELYGFSSPNIIGVFGPKGLPGYVLKKLEDVFAKAVKDPDYVKVMNRLGLPITYMNRDQMGKYVDQHFPEVCRIFKELRAEEAKEKK
jgi:tripartite-type tricarboxylate transporter receptor subunit TctC